METTVSFRTDHVMCAEHNMRYEPMVKNESHINLNEPHEIWRHKDEKEVYNFLFDDALREYNEKQKRADRKITDYYESVKNDKRGKKNKRTKESSKHTSYEVIIQIGNSEFEKDENKMYVVGNDGERIQPNMIDENEGKEIMRRFVDDWEKRNPNLHLYGAYYHADEDGAPHVHLDFIPVATGYTKGMKKQSAIGRALRQQGFDDNGNMKENAYTLWQERERHVLEDLCIEYGHTVIHPCRGKKIDHLPVKEYKEVQQLKDELINLNFDKDGIVDHYEFFRSENERLKAENIQVETEKNAVIDLIKIYNDVNDRLDVENELQTVLRGFKDAERRHIDDILRTLSVTHNNEKISCDKWLEIKLMERARTVANEAIAPIRENISKANRAKTEFELKIESIVRENNSLYKNNDTQKDR